MTARSRILPLFVPHLGCPHQCVFCNQRHISGSRVPAVPEDVCRCITRAPGDGYELAFYGGSFTAIPAREQEALLGAALPFLRSGKLRAIRLSTRPDAIDSEVLARLRRYGVGTVELGAQSMLDPVLTAAGRGHTAADTVRAARAVKAAGFSLVLQMMTGLHGDDDEGALETARRLIALKPDAVRIYPTVVIRDTPLYTLWQQGAYAAHTVEQAVALCARLLPLFQAAGIPVIRLGLNPTEELSAGQAAAGAYHPALGELVRSRIYLDRARALLADVPAGAHIALHVHPSRVSVMIGQHRSNLTALTGEFAPASLKVVPDAVEFDEIRLFLL